MALTQLTYGAVIDGALSVERVTRRRACMAQAMQLTAAVLHLRSDLPVQVATVYDAADPIDPNVHLLFIDGGGWALSIDGITLASVDVDDDGDRPVAYGHVYMANGDRYWLQAGGVGGTCRLERAVNRALEEAR